MDGNPTLKEKEILFTTESAQETVALGRKIGSFLVEGDILALAGDLGSGKTWLTKGIALGLGVSHRTMITSPSFALVNEYKGIKTLFHMDVYRLGSLSEFLSAGLEEYLYLGGVVVMEWADRWPDLLPDRSLWVELTILDEERRRIHLSGHHPRSIEILRALEANKQ